MIEAFLWWLAMVGAGGVIAYLLWWGIGALGVPDPFQKYMRGAVGVAVVVFLIYMIFRLFAILGHPIA